MAVQQEEFDKNSVERTLCIPLWCRALAVEKLPQILPDHDAARILREMGQTKPPTVFYRMECACLAGAIRQYDFAKEIEWYLREHPDAVVVEMGAGLSCLRRQIDAVEGWKTREHRKKGALFTYSRNWRLFWDR